MAIVFDSDVNDKIISILNISLESLNLEIRNQLLVDFDPFTQVSLFSEQLNTLKNSLDDLEKLYDKLKTYLQENKDQWALVDNQIGAKIDKVVTEGKLTGVTSQSGSNKNGSSDYLSSSNMNSINRGISIDTNRVSKFIADIDDDTVISLLKKLYKFKGENDFFTLLTESRGSGVLLWMLKRILGDTTADLSSDITLESESIQRALLLKANKDNYDLSTEEGKTNFEKVTLEKINDPSVDESKLYQAIYGDKTVSIDLLGGTWVVAKTKNELQNYASYVSNNGIKQDVDVGKYGDSCLSFSYTHAYDLYAGTKTTTAQAGDYAHSYSFQDFINDDKGRVLEKIYSEIMSGRPVILQVNGNKEGTSRHFVTVVGFKNGITSAESLTEKDLLIIDSWDGNIERMDTSTSRFMTTGAACGKEYSGYRLRIFKDEISA